MFNDNCPICKKSNIKNNICRRCLSDTTELRRIENRVINLYNSIFLAIRCEQYISALHLIKEVKFLKKNSFIIVMEEFVNYMKNKHNEIKCQKP